MSKAVKMSDWNGKYSEITFLAPFRFLHFLMGPWVALRWENDIVFSFALNFSIYILGPDRTGKQRTVLSISVVASGLDNFYVSLSFNIGSQHSPLAE